MYSEPRASQFRRPWSPDLFEPAHEPSGSRNPVTDLNSYDEYPQFASRQQRREASDASVEALDLADYSLTLRTRQQDRYPIYPPYPSPSHPLDTLQTPSLVSRGGTRSSNSHSAYSRSHRPFSLPSLSINNHNTSRRSHNLPEAHIRSQDSEIDISHFPSWSRNWYDTPGSIGRTSSPPDLYTPIPASHLNVKKSPFDPGQIYPESDDISSDAYVFAPVSSHGHESTRNLLPWGPDPPDSAPIHSSLKQERIRMLEREFGSSTKVQGPVESDDGQMLDENGKPVVGTVNAQGYLVTQGPKKRAAFRILQIILAIAAAVPSIYAAVAIRPNERPPPAGKPPAYVLYVLSVISGFLLIYLFIFRPCCCAGKRSKSVNTPFSNGMMVLPIQGLVDRKNGKNKKGGKGKAMNSGDVQVNLIVDPEAFGRREESSEEEDDQGGSGSIPGDYHSRGNKRSRRPRRKSVFAGLAMEESWKKARGWTKKLAFIDVSLLFLWGAAFVYIMIGERCPSGAFDGWCNAYNVSTAASCLLSVSFGVTTFFNVKDLNDSKASPRTRT